MVPSMLPATSSTGEPELFGTGDGVVPLSRDSVKAAAQSISSSCAPDADAGAAAPRAIAPAATAAAAAVGRTGLNQAIPRSARGLRRVETGTTDGQAAALAGCSAPVARVAGGG